MSAASPPFVWVRTVLATAIVWFVAPLNVPAPFVVSYVYGEADVTSTRLPCGAGIAQASKWREPNFVHSAASRSMLLVSLDASPLAVRRPCWNPHAVSV